MKQSNVLSLFDFPNLISLYYQPWWRVENEENSSLPFPSLNFHSICSLSPFPSSPSPWSCSSSLYPSALEQHPDSFLILSFLSSIHLVIALWDEASCNLTTSETTTEFSLPLGNFSPPKPSIQDHILSNPSNSIFLSTLVRVVSPTTIKYSMIIFSLYHNFFSNQYVFLIN